ncbi:MAG: hypothetical protein F9K29_22420 [Hyphomicrobiaceae bacterium]|nr:MAG: hypothetical protein F9K29_22420 [Hyphomicrobiaceae bacterium]
MVRRRRIAWLLVLPWTGCAQQPPQQPIVAAPVVVEKQVYVPAPAPPPKVIVKEVEKRVEVPAPAPPPKSKVIVVQPPPTRPAVLAKSPCKGLTQAACSVRKECSWTEGYKRKDGKSVDGYCRLSTAKR